MTSLTRKIHRSPGQAPMVMGIINVTPDSFSDGGQFTDETAILAQAEKMVADGVDILDIGGESTRPGSLPVPPDEEASRVLTAIRAIRQRFTTPISIDTTKEAVARQALDEGADIINDISGLRFDPALTDLLREREAPVIIMHMQGTPGNMQQNPTYGDVIGEILSFLSERVAWAESRGISKERMVVDPGIGFGKTVAHNLTIIKHLDRFGELGCPVLIGHSRKAFIGKTLDLEVTERDTATAILSGISTMKGVSIIRVHDVAATVQAVKLATAVTGAPDR